MAKIAIKKASTDVTLYVFIQASNVTTGAGLTGLAYNTADLVASYVRPLAARQALSLATLAAVDSAHSDGGFKEIDATNMPGVYRLDLPDAVCATGVNSVVVMLKGAANMAPLLLEIQLTDFDLNDASPNVTVADIANDAITAAAIATDAIDADSIKADAITEIQAGLATATALTAVDDYIDTEIAAIKAKTDLINTGTTLTIASAVVGSTITAHRGDTLSAALENIGALTNYSKIWFTVKRDYADADSASIIQIEKTGGLLYINGAAATTAANGSITIDDEPTGDVTIALVAARTAELNPGNYVYDIQILRSSGTAVSTLTYGEFVVAADVTKATA